MKKPKYAHQRVLSPKTLASRGKVKYRSITTKSGDVLRIAFPRGKRKTGAGELQAILHKKKNPLTGLEKKNVLAEANVHRKIKGRKAEYYRGMADGMKDIAEEYASNPRPVKVYDRVIEIVAKKGKGHECDAECKRAHHTYIHKFSGHAKVYGNKDGSLTIRG